MPPKETDHLLQAFETKSNDNDSSVTTNEHHHHSHHHTQHRTTAPCCPGVLLKNSFGPKIFVWLAVVVAVTATILLTTHLVGPAHYPCHNGGSEDESYHNTSASTSQTPTTGPYRLLQVQEGTDFWSFYNFYMGNDTVGSMGYNVYVNRSRAQQIGIVQTIPSSPVSTMSTSSTSESSHPDDNYDDDDDDDDDNEDPRDIIRIQSKASEDSGGFGGGGGVGGPRESIRLEGKHRFQQSGGLFILDVDHIPAGCGQWPAFWLADTDHWPNHGEIDIVEGINTQSFVKTALHTSDHCSMYAHVPSYRMTGQWDRATGIPDTYTGKMDNATTVPADNCYVMAPHQWLNQGCVVQSEQNNTLGVGLNTISRGGIYVLQWDPFVTQSIQSWVFPKNSLSQIPTNLLDSIQSASPAYRKKRKRRRRRTINHNIPDIVATVEAPDPQSWDVLPYGYFAIGNTSGCSEDHFQNMNLIFNLAFCGTVAGNRFFMDCPQHVSQSTTTHDPIQACNDYVASNPDDLQEAYWSIRGVYVYARE
jgi:hypothetical protein